MYSRLKFVGNTSKKVSSDLVSNSDKASAIFFLRLFSLILRAVPMQYYTSTIQILYKYYTNTILDKCTESQVCNDCTFRWNSVCEVKHVRLSMYFRFKVLIYCVNAWPNGYNSIYLNSRYYCIGHKYQIQNTATIKYMQH